MDLYSPRFSIPKSIKFFGFFEFCIGIMVINNRKNRIFRNFRFSLCYIHFKVRFYRISTLVSRRVLSGQLSIIDGLFSRVLLNRHLEDVFQGFDLLLFGRAQHIGLSTCFVWTVINYWRSILQSVVESAFRRRFPGV